MNNLTMKWWQLLLLFTTSFPAQATMDFVAYKIVHATQVKLKAQPTLDSNNIGNPLPLGTVGIARKRTIQTEQVNGEKDYWYYMEVNDDLGGWVFGKELSDYSPKNRENIYFTILEQRLSEKTYRFHDMMASYRFIERILPSINNYNLQAQLKLMQLVTLQKSLDIMGTQRQKTPEQQQLLQENRQRIVFDSISSRWLITAKTYWNLADYYANHRASDQISWYAASAPLAGDCKADIDCTLQRELATTAAYLQRSPGGAYIDFALSQLQKTLSYTIRALNENANTTALTPNIQQNIRALTQIVKRTSASAKNRLAVLAQLQALQTNNE